MYLHVNPCVRGRELSNVCGLQGVSKSLQHQLIGQAGIKCTGLVDVDSVCCNKHMFQNGNICMQCP